MVKKLCFVAMMACLASAEHIEVYETSACGCCDKWVEYMRENGYTATVYKDDDKFLATKARFGIKPDYQSCHTGIIGDFAIEGHVPFSAIKWLLAHKPSDAIGISALGMPQGSPGMEQGAFEEYPVILMLKNGNYEVLGYYKGDKLVRGEKIRDLR